MEQKDLKWWRVGIDAVFGNMESPAGSMDARETSSTICTRGFIYTRANNFVKAREEALSMIKRTYLEPLLNVAYLNTCIVPEHEATNRKHLSGLTLR